MVRGVFMIVLVSACGREQPAVTPDADLVFDATVVDLLECPFSGCSPTFPLNAADGGEIRIENLIFPDGSARALTTAYFVKSQDGDPHPQPFPNVVDSDVLHCNTYADRIYPFGDASDTIGAPATYGIDREYRDVGEKITLQSRDGATAAFDLLRYENFVTPFLGGAFHELTYNPDLALGDPYLAVPVALIGGTGDIATGHQLVVTIPGGGDLPGGAVLDFEGEHSGIEIPPRPAIADFARLDVPSTMTIRRTEPFTRTWTIPPEAPEDLLAFVAVFDAAGDLRNLCYTARPGKITIRPEDLATMPDDGTLFVAHLFHRVQTFDNVRRIDMVGTAATSTAFSMVP